MSDSSKLFYNFVKDRINKNKNLLIGIVGDTGSGKSYAALSLAKYLDPDFDDSRIIFNPVELFDKILNKELKRGSVLVLDEASVASLPSREWYSLRNRVLGSLLQIFRYMNLIVIFTMPDFSFIDVQARKLFHYVLQTFKIDYEAELTFLFIRRIWIDRLSGQIIKGAPKVNLEGMDVRRADVMSVQKPPSYLTDAYERKKHAFVMKKLRSDKKMLQDFYDSSSNPKGGAWQEV